MSMPNRWTDFAWTLALLLAAVLLFCLNLGELPLRDWDEGIAAQVARDIWRSQNGVTDGLPNGNLTWLYPTIAGATYFNKPPLVHWLMALSYQVGGVNELTSRLPGALLTALSVPLLYQVGRELWPRRTPAILAALVYLTLLPVLRHGRLAMLDGAVLCFFLLTLLSVLRARRDLRWSLGIGLGLGLVTLTKGAIAGVVGLIVLAFVWLDTPRLITSGTVWTGILIGMLPAVAWYGAQWLHYGQSFFTVNLMEQAVNRLLTPVEQNRGAPWYYLLEILKYGWPWLLFIPAGCRLAWENRNWSWGKLVLVWVGGYLLIIATMSTKLPWYVLPVYPALALIVGAELATLWDDTDIWGGLRSSKSAYPQLWSIGLGILAIAGWVGVGWFSTLGPQPRAGLPLVFLAVALTMTVATILVLRRNSQFIAILCWGMAVSLLLLVLSPYWIWELAEDYPVKPVGDLLRTYTPPHRTVFTSHASNRPSLNFYSDRVVRPAAPEALKQIWKQPTPPYLLIHQDTLDQLKLPKIKQLGRSGDWLLITRQPETKTMAPAKRYQ